MLLVHVLLGRTSTISVSQAEAVGRLSILSRYLRTAEWPVLALFSCSYFGCDFLLTSHPPAGVSGPGDLITASSERKRTQRWQEQMT